MPKKKALIMVDLQNDFCKGGSLAVPGGETIIPLANQLQYFFPIVVATQDWHPQDHVSFSSNHPQRQTGEVITLGHLTQVLWPDHCVQDTHGAAFHPQLKLDRVNKVFHKGIDKHIDSYSAFFDNAHQRSTGLETYLRSENIKDIYIMGLATDYCVKFSSLDAIHLGFNVHVIADACRGVDLKSGDVDDAFEEMRTAGVELVCSQEIFAKARFKATA